MDSLCVSAGSFLFGWHKEFQFANFVDPTVAAPRDVLQEMLVYEILQNSQENTYAKVSFQSEACNFIKKSLWHMCFPVNFAKFVRTSFFQNTSGRLLLTRWRLK